MKKIALVAVLATSAAVAAPFNGFSVGGNLGASFGKFKESFGLVSTKKKTSFIGSLFAGYTKSFNCMFVGLDLGLGFEGKSQFKDKDDSSYSFNFKPGIAFQISPRIGYKFNDTTAGYFKLGMSAAKHKWTMKFDAPSAADRALGYTQGFELASGNKSVLSWTPALGLEKAFGNVSMRGELGYKMAGNKKVFTKANHKQAQANSEILATKIKANAVVLTVGVAYNF